LLQLLSKIRVLPDRDNDKAQRGNELLTQKLHTFEEGFKLQNETLKQELKEVSGEQSEELNRQWRRRNKGP
jgi:hypothetical protein